MNPVIVLTTLILIRLLIPLVLLLLIGTAVERRRVHLL